MENDKKKRIIKIINSVLDVIISVLLISLIVVLVTECSADSSLGFVRYGNTWLSFGASSDPSYSSVSNQWTFDNITDSSVQVFIPDYGVVGSSQLTTSQRPFIIFNKLCDYSVSYEIANPHTGESVTTTYDGSGYSCRPIKEADLTLSNNSFIYNLYIEITNDPNVYSDDLFGTWDLPQFLTNTNGFQGGEEYGYWDIEGSITNPNGTNYDFYEMRYYFDTAGDYVNLYVTTFDAGEIRIIQENESLYRYLRITDAPSGIPNRLLVYLQDNAFNLDSQGLSVSIAGFEPNISESGFDEFLSSVRWKINDLQTLIDDYLQEGASLWGYIVTSIESFFSLNIGGITLGAVFGTLLSVSILIAFLKLFLGG